MLNSWNYFFFKANAYRFRSSSSSLKTEMLRKSAISSYSCRTPPSNWVEENECSEGIFFCFFFFSSASTSISSSIFFQSWKDTECEILIASNHSNSSLHLLRYVFFFNLIFTPYGFRFSGWIPFSGKREAWNGLPKGCLTPAIRPQ